MIHTEQADTKPTNQQEHKQTNKQSINQSINQKSRRKGWKASSKNITFPYSKISTWPGTNGSVVREYGQRSVREDGSTRKSFSVCSKDSRVRFWGYESAMGYACAAAFPVLMHGWLDGWMDGWMGGWVC